MSGDLVIYVVSVYGVVGILMGVLWVRIVMQHWRWKSELGRLEDQVKGADSGSVAHDG